ncbi:DUF4124 domain-containing protein [Allochromatium tepidum]|uniref:DUF4124 domain-containing protein n=1 Tax=Allochromatium tepidum TaxID=553982 RepID=A0ABM7QRV6_9GAMM|nr:DUF4124 domain-containing protein [Allochromatium tepidum]BCU08400.1 hypothetical protein Atep_30770 [Allochromatium tepidum]
MRRFVLIAPLTLLAAYRCQDAKGRVTFSDEPCGPAAEIVELEVHRPSAAQRREAQRRADDAVAITDEIMRQRTRQRALAREAEIRFHEERRLQAEREQAEREAERSRTAGARTLVSDRRPPPPMGPPSKTPPPAHGIKPPKRDRPDLKPPPKRPPKPRPLHPPRP